MNVRRKSDNFIKLKFAGISWCIRRRYELKKRIGSGSFGIVASATDSVQGSYPVAIKKVDGVFHRKPAYEARRILREVRLMRCLNHPNVITLLDVMLPPSTHDDASASTADSPRGTALPLLSELYLVTELMSTDLQHVLSAAHRPGSSFVLKAEQTQYLLYQLICGVQYIGSAGVLHRDLKPANLLVDLRSCQLRICDFGLARAIPKQNHSSQENFRDRDFEVERVDSQGSMTEYVVTRWYRAPEILLGNVHYGPGIDVWSVGCILAEMLAPNMGVLFEGTERREMLAHIVSLLGRPTQAELWFILDKHARDFMESLPTQKHQETLRRRISKHCSLQETAVRLFSCDKVLDLPHCS
tara:strand:- start:717 stop:1784 length:1068 start_codon:yes stop_codon:yes gene_type:complete